METLNKDGVDSDRKKLCIKRRDMFKVPLQSSLRLKVDQTLKLNLIQEVLKGDN